MRSADSSGSSLYMSADSNSVSATTL
jgi:hypothetical protein